VTAVRATRASARTLAPHPTRTQRPTMVRRPRAATRVVWTPEPAEPAEHPARVGARLTPDPDQGRVERRMRPLRGAPARRARVPPKTKTTAAAAAGRRELRGRSVRLRCSVCSGCSLCFAALELERAREADCDLRCEGTRRRRPERSAKARPGAPKRRLDLDIVSQGNDLAQARGMLTEAIFDTLKHDVLSGRNPLARQRAPQGDWDELANVLRCGQKRCGGDRPHQRRLRRAGRDLDDLRPVPPRIDARAWQQSVNSVPPLGGEVGSGRSHRRYCSASCRVMACRARRKEQR
jgi:hypothetical protein